MRNFRDFLKIISLLCIVAFVDVSQASNNDYRILKDDQHGWSVLARSPGNYCFKKDLKQKDSINFLRLPHQSGPNSPILATESANVTVDLQQHVLDGDRPAALGLWVNGGTIFEDNEIIFSVRETKANSDPPIGIYFEDADDSIIRNNRIIVKGGRSDTEAIVLKNSANVTLQGNSIIGGKQTFKLLGQARSVLSIKWLADGL